MRPKQVVPLGVSESGSNGTFPKSPEVEFPHQMQFSVIPKNQGRLTSLQEIVYSKQGGYDFDNDKITLSLILF